MLLPWGQNASCRAPSRLAVWAPARSKCEQGPRVAPRGGAAAGHARMLCWPAGRGATHPSPADAPLPHAHACPHRRHPPTRPCTCSTHQPVLPSAQLPKEQGPEELYAALNIIKDPSMIRVEADEVGWLDGRLAGWLAVELAVWLVMQRCIAAPAGSPCMRPESFGRVPGPAVAARIARTVAALVALQVTYPLHIILRYELEKASGAAAALHRYRSNGHGSLRASSSTRHLAASQLCSSPGSRRWEGPAPAGMACCPAA